MKKFLSLLMITVITMITVGVCNAAPLRGPQGYSPAVAPEAENTLLSAVTTNGPGTAVDLQMTAGRYACQVNIAGDIPTNIVVKLQGSLDNTYWYDLATHTFAPTEMVSNGTFTGAATGWTEGAGWVYDSNTEPKSAAGVGGLVQALASMTRGFSIGESYLLNYDLTVTVATGGVTPSVCGVTGTNIAASSTPATQLVTCTAATGDLTFTPGNTAFRGVLDNVSLVKSTDYFSIVNKPARYIRGNYYSKSGGGTTTEVTLKCNASGQP